MQIAGFMFPIRGFDDKQPVFCQLQVLGVEQHGSEHGIALIHPQRAMRF